MAKNITIKLAKSLNGRLEKQVATAHSLGLRKIGDVTVQPDNDSTRPAARSPRSATCCRSPKRSKGGRNHEIERTVSR